eukprot:SAG31_NODE_2970_length_4839_cov_2.684810_5_plen_256_part_00
MHIYLDNCAECGGPTVFALPESANDPAYTLRAMSMMPGVRGHPRFQSRAAAEDYFASDESLAEAAQLRRKLYARERAVPFEVGTVALYQIGVWHRGTPVLPVRVQFTFCVSCDATCSDGYTDTSLDDRGGNASSTLSCSAALQRTGFNVALGVRGLDRCAPRALPSWTRSWRMPARHRDQPSGIRRMVTQFGEGIQDLLARPGQTRDTAGYERVASLLSDKATAIIARDFGFRGKITSSSIPGRTTTSGDLMWQQ